MPNQCPLCKVRVSDWQMAAGKTAEVGSDVVHKACMIDYKLRTGREYGNEAKPS